MNEQFIRTTVHEEKGDWSMVNLHSHDYYELYFLAEGKRQLLFEDKLVELEEGSLVVIAPFTMHKTEGGNFRRINVYIGRKALSQKALELLAEFSKAGVITFPKPMASQAESILSELLALEEGASKDNAEYKKILVDFLMYFIEKHANKEGKPSLKAEGKTPPTLMHIIQYLRANFHEKITLADISERFFVSSVTVCNYFKNYLGVTFGEYLTNLRITKAKELLLTTKKSMEEIALLLGLGSANYFGLFFKKHTGLSPLQYRKQGN